IDITLATGVLKFGFLVGLAGEAQSSRQNVSFFDTANILLGTVDVSSDGGLVFVGFENPGGLIGRALVTDVKNNLSVVTIDDLEVQPVPLPAALPLFAGGLGLMGWFGRRKKRA